MTSGFVPEFLKDTQIRERYERGNIFGKALAVATKAFLPTFVVGESPKDRLDRSIYKKMGKIPTGLFKTWIDKDVQFAVSSSPELVALGFAAANLLLWEKPQGVAIFLLGYLASKYFYLNSEQSFSKVIEKYEQTEPKNPRH